MDYISALTAAGKNAMRVDLQAICLICAQITIIFLVMQHGSKRERFIVGGLSVIVIVCQVLILVVPS